MSGIAWTLQEAIGHHQAGRLADAEAIYRQVLAQAPDNADALHLLGLVKRRLGEPALAVELISRAIELRPDSFVYRNNLGLSLLEQGRPGQAESCFRAALSLNPQFVEAMVNLGNCLRALGRPDEAGTLYRQALALRPDLVEAHNNLGNVLRDLGGAQEAAACYAAALRLRPDYAEANNNLGVLLQGQDRLDEALACLRRALDIDPRNVDALCNLAAALRDQGRLDQAFDCYRKALQIRPDDVMARWAMVMTQIPLVYTDEQQVAAARAAFADALAQLDAWFVADRLDAGERAVGCDQPYYLAYQEQDNRALLAQYGGLCNRIMQRWQRERGIAPYDRARDGPIRVGIVSGHIHEHSVWRALIRGWLQQLDRRRFELHVFDLGREADDQTSLATSLAQSSTAGNRTLAQWAAAIVASRAEVLIYPEIGMDPMTVKLANLRLAPTQLAAWGHPETTGLPTIDGFLSAELFEPDDAQRHYSERLIRLPHLGCHYEPLPVEPQEPDLASLGLDACRLLLCPGTPYKYLPAHDRVWVGIARALPDCRLVFFRHRKQALSQQLQLRLQAAFAQAGLHFDDHVVFIGWQRRAAYYGLMRRAWLCLDTIGFSGFNTAMQAIECGLPIVTLEGRFMRGRFASGILRRLGMDELVAADVEAYIRLAIEIARRHEYRRSLAERIDAGKAILFSDPAPIRAMEACLAQLARASRV